MNRHHFSLFVRNCRLILLLRREFGDGDLKSFRPAEFRWKLPQVQSNDNSSYNKFNIVQSLVRHLTFE
jgi:hypothetical protein